MTTRVEIKNKGPKTIKIVRVDNKYKTADVMGILKVDEQLETYFWDVNSIKIDEVVE